MKTYLLEGLLCNHRHGEAYDVLFLSSLHDPLAEELQDRIARKKVTVRYWITSQPCTKDEASEEFMKTLMGVAETRFSSAYSELTGYLWTDEWAKVGGHDLIQELKYEVGKWLILEIEVLE